MPPHHATLPCRPTVDAFSQVKNKPVCNSLGTKRTVLKEMNHEMDELRLLLQVTVPRGT